ncbi:hypothetical protein POTOM_023075 [Populus tomentosa]|uniref:Thioredoxin superfamily protein n=1 Tax=Populus tomentosa TaxID=118781 RepID=A0A8X7ZSQ6_POPTO|nr:hypothetical protein POTOM_023075 [Populus tomentosa]
MLAADFCSLNILSQGKIANESFRPYPTQPLFSFLFLTFHCSHFPRSRAEGDRHHCFSHSPCLYRFLSGIDRRVNVLGYYETVSSPLLSFLVLPSLLFLFVTPSDSSEYGIPKSPDPHVWSRRISRNSEKVTMSLCYEFLCPYCNSFIADPLAQVLETDLMTILNLRLVPWGNAILDSNNTIECQVAFPSSDFVSFFFFKNVLSKFRCDHLLLWFFGSMGKRNAI